MKYHIILLLSLIALPLFAEEIDVKTTLHKNITEKTPNKACQNNTLFLDCYQTTQQECKEYMSLTSELCFKMYEHEISENKTMNDLLQTGNKIGQCAGLFYHQIFVPSKRYNEACLKDPKWKKTNK